MFFLLFKGHTLDLDFIFPISRLLLLINISFRIFEAIALPRHGFGCKKLDPDTILSFFYISLPNSVCKSKYAIYIEVQIHQLDL